MTTNNALNLTQQGMAYYNGVGVFTAPTLTQFGIVVGTTANEIATIPVGVTGSILIGNTGANPSFTTALTNGQLLIGSTGLAPVPATLTAGTGITITNGAGTITIAASGTSWVDQTTTPVTVVAGTGYVSDLAGATRLIYNLPAAPTFGDTYIITGRSNAGANTGGWEVASSGTQFIVLGTAQSAAGGNIQSTQETDSVRIVCTHASGLSSEFTVIASVGNITVN